MQLALSLVGPVVALLLFGFVASGMAAKRENNWFKVAASIYGLLLVLPATSTFATSQSASALELFSFVAYSLGACAGALLPFQLNNGGWQIKGLLPQWENKANAHLPKPSASSGPDA